MSPCQSGFVSGRSTLSQLLLAHHSLIDSINDRACVDVVYTDLSKAFDSIAHNKLLIKLHAYGINPLVCGWIRSFLSDRKQRVVVNGTFSDWLSCPSGVPQGSVLGPILFNLYINDLPDHVIHSSIHLYADDAKLLKRINCRLDCILFQRDIDALSVWCKLWQLKLNINKCMFVRFGLVDRPHFSYSIDDIVLHNATSANDLGVVFDSKLSFSEHCSKVTNKAFMRTNIILRCFSTHDPKFLMQLFNVYVRPLLEYNSPVWSPKFNKDVATIEQVQRYFTRNLFGLSRHSYEERLLLLKQPSLEARRLRIDLIFLYKVLHNLTDNNLRNYFVMASNNNRSLRGNECKLFIPKPRSDMLKYSFFYRVIVLWNSLPFNVVSADLLALFKTRLSENL